MLIRTTANAILDTNPLLDKEVDREGGGGQAGGVAGSSTPPEGDTDGSGAGHGKRTHDGEGRKPRLMFRVKLEGHDGEVLSAVLVENPRMKEVKGKGRMKIWTLELLDSTATAGAAGAGGEGAADSCGGAEGGKEGSGSARIGEGESEGVALNANAESEATVDGINGVHVGFSESKDADGARRPAAAAPEGRGKRRPPQITLLVRNHGGGDGGGEGQGPDGTEQGVHGQDLYHTIQRAHFDPNHWRFKLGGILHYNAQALLEAETPPGMHKSFHGVPNDHSVHGIPQTRGQRFSDSMTQLNDTNDGLYGGLDQLPYEEYLFNAEHPYHPLFLTFYNPKLEQLFCDRRRCHRLAYRLYGVSFFTIASLASFLIDIPVLLECRDCSVFVVSVSVGLALQVVMTVLLLWLLYVFKRSPSRGGADVCLPISNQLYDLILITHVVATYFVLAASATIFPAGELPLVMTGKGLLHVHCFPRLIVFLFMASFDGAWRIPNATHVYALVLGLVIFFVVGETVLRSPTVPLCRENEAASDEAEWDVRYGLLQNYVPIWATGLILCYSMRSKEVELRRRLGSIIQAQLLRSKVEVAVCSLMPPHVLKAHMKAAIDIHQSLVGGDCSNGSDALSSQASRTESIGVQESLRRSTSNESSLLTIGDAAVGLARACQVNLVSSFCPEYLPNVVLLMADIQGFTSLSSDLNAKELFAGAICLPKP